MILQEINIVKKLREDGIESYAYSFEDYTNSEDGELIPWLDGLGLLSAAQADFIEAHRKYVTEYDDDYPDPHTSIE